MAQPLFLCVNTFSVGLLNFTNSRYTWYLVTDDMVNSLAKFYLMIDYACGGHSFKAIPLDVLIRRYTASLRSKEVCVLK